MFISMRVTTVSCQQTFVTRMNFSTPPRYTPESTRRPFFSLQIYKNQPPFDLPYYCVNSVHKVPDKKRSKISPPLFSFLSQSFLRLLNFVPLSFDFSVAPFSCLFPFLTYIFIKVNTSNNYHHSAHFICYMNSTN
jgi:hypothetical protein